MTTAKGRSPEPQTVIVRSVDPAAEGHSRLRLEVPTEVTQRHVAPGQFVEIRPGPDLKGYFALANAPGDETAELLVKHGAGVADAIVAASPGDGLDVVGPMGRGFAVDAHLSHDVLLFAGGSGISAIRSVIRHLARRRDGWGRVILFYGVRDRAVMAYHDELAAWQESGIEVEVVYSRPGPDWEGPTGYVQARLEALAPSFENAVACLCGVSGMHEAVTAQLLAGGMPKERVLTNY